MISFGYSGFKVHNIGKKLCRVYEYSDSVLKRSWIVFAHYDGGHVPTFIDMNESVEQFVIDFEDFSEYLIFNL